MAKRADNGSAGSRGAGSRGGNAKRAGGTSRPSSHAHSPSRSNRQASNRQVASGKQQHADGAGSRQGRGGRATGSRGTSSRQVRSGRAVAGRPPATGQRDRVGNARQRRVPGVSRDALRPEEDMVSTSVRELRQADRAKRLQKSARRHTFRIIAIVGVIVVLLGGWAALYHSPAFTIKNVEVNGVKHLTSEEMAQLANVPADTTLLRVDTATIESRVEQNAWVADAQVSQVFPDTLVINVTERPVSAVVEIPSSSGSTIKQWAISDDHIWLMPIPDVGSEASKSTSSQVYEDAENALHIVDVPYGTKAEIGKECTDDNVNNALDIVSGLTTDLADRVAQVSAAGTAETTLILDDGVEIAFGKAEDIRDKERVILKILEENPNVAYINVRMVETPTWRGV